MKVRFCGLPLDADESATGLEIAATYLATLAVTFQAPWPVGSQTMPSRGLHALSWATTSPDWAPPSFLSKRTPTLAVNRSVIRQLSLMNPECVRKSEPLLSSMI